MRHKNIFRLILEEKNIQDPNRYTKRDVFVYENCREKLLKSSRFLTKRYILQNCLRKIHFDMI